MPKTTPLRRLLDLSEIHGLKARYCRCIDTKQWRALGELFTADARFEGFGSAPTGADRETFVAGVSTRLADAVSVHHCHMPEIEFTGPDEARGIWAMEDYVDFPQDQDVLEAPGHRAYRGYGHYEEAYRREGEAWRFSFLRLTRLRIDPVSQADPPPRPGRLSASTSWLEAVPSPSRGPAFRHSGAGWWDGEGCGGPGPSIRSSSGGSVHEREQ